MIRNFSLFLLPVVTGLFLWACTSPTDVPANRKITPNTQSFLKVEPGQIDFGEKQLQQPFTFEATIRNTSATQSADIVSLRLKNQTEEFSIGGPGLPLRLEPQQAVTVPIVFYANQPGVYTDTLLVNLDGLVSCPLRAVVPASEYAVWITDVHFGALNASQTKTMTCTIYNEGDAIAVLTDISIMGPDATVFTLFIPLPLAISPGEFVHLSVKASPSTQNPATATMRFSINYDGTGIVDNIAELKVNQ